jgi:hypothetical protein
MLRKYSCLVVGVGVAALLSQPSTAWAQAGPNLAIAMSHTGNFTLGENGVYTLVVSNAGGTASSGTMIAGLVLNGNGSGVPGMPAFSFVSATGTGWSCSEFYGFPAYWIEVTCASTSVIAAGGSASPISLTVNPYGFSGTVTNIARVAYPCTPDGITCTNVHTSPSDVTIVLAAVPTLPEWAMIVLSALLALAGATALRRRTT